MDEELISELFDVKQGLRQGCVISPLLLNILADVLRGEVAITIRSRAEVYQLCDAESDEQSVALEHLLDVGHVIRR